MSLDVGPLRRGCRLQAHLGLGLRVRYLCFVTGDHKQSGSKDACFLSHTFCGRSSAWGLGRMWSSWALISSENQERLSGHVVVGKMQLLMAAGGRSHTLEGCQLGTAQPLASWPPPQDVCPMAFFKLVDPVFSIPALCREGWARL